MAERGWEFCFIGGLSVQRWGKPRVTADADITLLTGLGGEGPFIDAILARYPARRPDARAFALYARVLLVRSAEGIPFDIALAGFPYEEKVVARSSPYHFQGGPILRTCSAEDLVVLKAIADRPRDWSDIESILVRQSRGIDRVYILEHLSPLCEFKEAPEIVARLEKLFRELCPPPSAD